MSFAQRSRNVERSTRAHNRRNRKVSVIGHLVALETRRMMHVDPNDPTHVDNDLPDDIGVFPVITANPTPGGNTSTGVATASSPLSSVPALSSRPSAAAKLYLDFDGDTTTTWGQYTPGATPAYDTDGDATTFSDAELANIREIWTRVSEKYSPFNIDVTTVNPNTLSNKVGAKVVFGGSGAWLGAQAGGVAYVGGFANSAPNVAFVFPKNLANGYAQYSAEAATHESGHLFNLQHQGQWSGTTLVNEYAPANAAGDAPIMGNSYTARRGMWWYGTASDAYGHIQDDLAVISSTTNAFGYRADDVGNDLPSASALTLSGTTVSAAGVITTTGDADVFSFVSGAGTVNLAADVNSLGAMLDLKLSLRDAAGNLLAAADSNTLGESLAANLTTSGTYYLTVASHGGYGDIGQYTVRGSIQPVTAAPLTAPTAGSAVAASATTVDLTWGDNSPDETGFVIQRSSDNGTTWTPIATTAANANTYRDATALVATTYTYRVAAIDATRTSDWSTFAPVTTPAAPVVPSIPAAPSNLFARALTSSSVRLTWVDNATNESGFRVYSSRDNRSWTYLGSVGANVTAVDNTGLRRNATYYYKLTAYNAAGESAASNTAQARTALISAALALPGDVNLDGAVDFNDLAVLSQNYNQNVTGGWTDGDLNADGIVDFNDLVSLSQNYNTALPIAASPDTGSDTGELTATDSGQLLTTTTTKVGTPVATKAKSKAVAKVFSIKPLAKPARPATARRA